MTHSLSPSTIPPPFARYSHGIETSRGARIVVTSGQLGISPDFTVPREPFQQARLCFDSITAILAEAGMRPSDTIRINAYVTDREYLESYMRARDLWLADVARMPASTLLIVSGFSRPEFKVEVEVTAASE